MPAGIRRPAKARRRVFAPLPSRAHVRLSRPGQTRRVVAVGSANPRRNPVFPRNPASANRTYQILSDVGGGLEFAHQSTAGGVTSTFPNGRALDCGSEERFP